MFRCSSHCCCDYAYSYNCWRRYRFIHDWFCKYLMLLVVILLDGETWCAHKWSKPGMTAVMLQNKSEPTVNGKWLSILRACQSCAMQELSFRQTKQEKRLSPKSNELYALAQVHRPRAIAWYWHTGNACNTQQKAARQELRAAAWEGSRYNCWKAWAFLFLSFQQTKRWIPGNALYADMASY